MFTSLFRAQSGEDRSPWGDFWFEPVSVRSASGMRVSADSAMRLSAVYACVRVLSETFATLPFCMYRDTGKGGKTAVKDHWLYNLIAKRPNRWQNTFEWREMMQGHLALRGNAYNRIIANARGEVTELVPLHPDRITVELMDSGDFRYRFKSPAGETEIIPRGSVFKISGLSSNGILGISPIEMMRETVGDGIAAQQFGARFFANDARPMGGWIESPGNFKNKEARDAFRESWQAAQAGNNRGKTAVLEAGMKYHEIGLSNKDSQLLELRQFNIADIARGFRIPPHLIADLSRATFTNIEQQSLEFVKYTMLPWAERWEAAIEDQLLFDNDAVEIEFDFANLERGDSAARSTFYSKGILDGWMTRNEVRARENLNPLPDLDAPLVPLNMSAAGKEPDPAEGSGNQAGTPIDEQDQDIESRLAAFIDSAARRIAHKEETVLGKLIAKHGAEPVAFAAACEDFLLGHSDMVADVLCIDHKTAVDWCRDLGLQMNSAAANGRDAIASEADRAERLSMIARGAVTN